MKAEVQGSLASDLYPNLQAESPGDVLARLENGARAICRPGADGQLSVVRYAHGPDTSVEVERLGLIEAKMVRVRQQPDDHWAVGPVPPELKGMTEEIPLELRGRVASVVKVGGLNKYAQTASVKLHRVSPGELRKVVDLPLIWLERADKTGSP